MPILQIHDGLGGGHAHTFARFTRVGSKMRSQQEIRRGAERMILRHGFDRERVETAIGGIRRRLEREAERGRLQRAEAERWYRTVTSQLVSTSAKPYSRSASVTLRIK